jgi:hypothetical protein
MTMHTVLTTNNSYDTLLLVNGNDQVVSRWDVTPVELASFLASGANANDWETGEWPYGFAPEDQDTEAASDELRTIAAYGREYGRDGVISDDSRKAFWSVA